MTAQEKLEIRRRILKATGTDIGEIMPSIFISATRGEFVVIQVEDKLPITRIGIKSFGKAVIGFRTGRN